MFISIQDHFTVQYVHIFAIDISEVENIFNSPLLFRPQCRFHNKPDDMEVEEIVFRNDNISVWNYSFEIPSLMQVLD